jgi:hypothetical protein
MSIVRPPVAWRMGRENPRPYIGRLHLLDHVVEQIERCLVDPLDVIQDEQRGLLLRC